MKREGERAREREREETQLVQINPDRESIGRERRNISTVFGRRAGSLTWSNLLESREKAPLFKKKITLM